MQLNVNNATTKRVNRADAYLENLVDKRILSPEGKRWLVLALDLFHDTEINPESFPDGANTSSVTEILNLSLDIRKPAALAAGPWTVHIFTLPIMFQWFMDPASILTVAPGAALNGWLPVTNVAAGSFQVGTLNVHAALDGTALGLFALSTTTLVGNLSIPRTFASGARMTSLGWEVKNSTALNFVQGMCTTYRTPTYQETETVNLFIPSTGASKASAAKVQELPPPPGATAQALQNLGSQQWEAKFGNYTVVPLTGVDNPPQSPANTGFYFFDPNLNRYFACNSAPPAALSVTTVGVDGFPDQLFLPIAQTGAFYTGLSDTTTLTLNMRFCLERFPNVQITAEQELVRLCRKCPARDYWALQIYSEVFRECAISVKQDKNSFGDWFIDVANKVLSTALPLIKMIPHPIAQAIGAAGSAIQPFVQTQAESNATKKKKKKENKQMVQPPVVLSRNNTNLTARALPKKK